MEASMDWWLQLYPGGTGVGGEVHLTQLFAIIPVFVIEITLGQITVYKKVDNPTLVIFFSTLPHQPMLRELLMPLIT